MVKRVKPEDFDVMATEMATQPQCGGNLVDILSSNRLPSPAAIRHSRETRALHARKSQSWPRGRYRRV